MFLKNRNMELIQNELIEKAFSLKFKSYFGLMTAVNKECYHLWMTDLQKWLREKHNIDITVITEWKEGKRFYRVGFSYINNNNKIDIWFSKQDNSLIINYNSFEEALEEGLKQALLLIK